MQTLFYVHVLYYAACYFYLKICLAPRLYLLCSTDRIAGLRKECRGCVGNWEETERKERDGIELEVRGLNPIVNSCVLVRNSTMI